MRRMQHLSHPDDLKPPCRTVSLNLHRHSVFLSNRVITTEHAQETRPYTLQEAMPLSAFRTMLSARGGRAIPGTFLWEGRLRIEEQVPEVCTSTNAATGSDTEDLVVLRWTLVERSGITQRER